MIMDDKEGVMIAMEHIKEYGGRNADNIMERLRAFKDNVDIMFIMLIDDQMAIKVLYDDLSRLLFSARCCAEERAKNLEIEREILE